jgi:DNA-binding response OmpR family regulator
VLRAFDAGVNDYVVKPFRPEEFVARVRRLAAQESHAASA